MLNLIHAVPKKFMPEADAQLILRGLKEAEAVELLKQEGFTSYIRSFICCQVLTGHIGIKVKPSKKYCPPPTKDTPTLISVPLFKRSIESGEILSEEEILATPVKWMLAELS